jgi:hypothetical protein
MEFGGLVAGRCGCGDSGGRRDMRAPGEAFSKRRFMI